MYTNNALVRIEAIGREAVNLPSSFDNLFATVEAGEYMSGNPSVHNTLGETEEFTVKTIDYDFAVTKYFITNAQYAEFLIDVYNQDLITVAWYSWNTGGRVKGAFHGHGLMEPLLQEDCEYSYEPGYELGDGYQNEIWGYGDQNSNCHNGYEWYHLPGSYNGRNGRISFNGTTFVVDAGYGDHPVNNISTAGAMAYAHYYGLRLATKEEMLKAANGMNTWDFVWGETPNTDSDYGELGKYMNYSGPNQSSCSFSNPWGVVDNSNSATTTPVGYFNGATYYYPDGFIENLGNYANCETIYEIQTEDAVSPYGLYDIQGNVRCRTSSYHVGENWPNNYISVGGSGWDGVDYQISTCLRPSGNVDNDKDGFRCARTINNNQ
jgi:formylglycine-generating enzyme required for sulfatase activity